MLPLLFIRQALVAVGIAVCLSACDFHPYIPRFTAGGFVADQDRLWRKDDDQHRAQMLLSVYSPYRSAGTVTTRYEHQNGVLRQIKRSNADGGRILPSYAL